MFLGPGRFCSSKSKIEQSIAYRSLELSLQTAIGFCWTTLLRLAPFGELCLALRVVIEFGTSSWEGRKLASWKTGRSAANQHLFVCIIRAVCTFTPMIQYLIAGVAFKNWFGFVYELFWFLVQNYFKWFILIRDMLGVDYTGSRHVWSHLH